MPLYQFSFGTEPIGRWDEIAWIKEIASEDEAPPTCAVVSATSVGEAKLKLFQGDVVRAARKPGK